MRRGERHRLLVTGASGFVGGWLTRMCREALPSCEITALGRGEIPGADRIVPLDITDRAGVDALISEARPTTVMHLAAVASVPAAEENPRYTLDVNFLGTWTLAHAVLRHAPNARFVYVGTSEVYGGTFRRTSVALDETALLDPTNTYAASKAGADLLVGQMAREGLQVVRFRPFNHTGPGQSIHFVVPAFAAQISRIENSMQEPVVRVGNLDVYRDFLDVRDVVRAYLAAMTRAEALEPGTILNIASGRPRSIKDILLNFVNLARVDIQIETDPKLIRSIDTLRAVGDATRAKTLLDWAPTIPWESTLQDVLEYWRGQTRLGTD